MSLLANTVGNRLRHWQGVVFPGIGGSHTYNHCRMEQAMNTRTWSADRLKLRCQIRTGGAYLKWHRVAGLSRYTWQGRGTSVDGLSHSLVRAALRSRAQSIERTSIRATAGATGVDEDLIHDILITVRSGNDHFQPRETFNGR